MTESDLNDRLRPASALLGFFWQRFEDAVSLGIPDAYLGAGAVGRAWVELKVQHDAEIPTFRKGQLAFAMRAEPTGERCVTAAVRGDGLIRVYRTAAVARYMLFPDREPYPAPEFTTYDAEAAVYAILGIARVGHWTEGVKS